MVRLGSEVVGIHKGKRFEGKLIAQIHPMPGMESFEDILYKVELPNGRYIEVTVNEFVGVGGSDAEEAE